MIRGLLLFTFLVRNFAMPYHVPLQGKLGGKRTLVLIEKNEYRQTYSIFFDLIQRHEHNVIIRTCNDKAFSGIRCSLSLIVAWRVVLLLSYVWPVGIYRVYRLGYRDYYFVEAFERFCSVVHICMWIQQFEQFNSSRCVHFYEHVELGEGALVELFSTEEVHLAGHHFLS